MSAKILWVQDEFNGPINGLLCYNNENLWFVREIDLINEEYLYKLYRLEDNIMKSVVENHQEYCKITGAPLYHGDPTIIKERQINKRGDLSKYKKDDGYNIDTYVKPLLMSNIYSHKLNFQNISGEYIDTIKQSEIVNYNVPRIVKTQ